MSTFQEACQDRINREAQNTADEYLPLLLEVVRLFRQSIMLKPAEDSFRQGWQEALRDETRPVSELWAGVDD